MVFCTPEQHEAFLDSAPEFEGMLRQGGTTLIKYWLDFSLEEETERMEARRLEPLKSGKTFSIIGQRSKNLMIMPKHVI